jgi:hypothetical protein
MFMSAREIAATTQQNETKMRTPEDVAHDPVAQQKLGTARRNGLAASIAKDGVKKPVDIIHNEYGTKLINGHHRFSVSLDIAPDRMIPVMHHSSYDTVDWTEASKDPNGYLNYGENEFRVTASQDRRS